MILAVAYGKFTLPGLQRALHATMATSSMVLLLAATSNIFGAVFARLGTANWITQSLLSLQMPPTLMLILILILIFLLGWPFEWPAIILVFLPIFYPVVAAMKIDLVWFGALVAVVLQTAFLSPPVAMSAYYLKQVVKDWSLATIYAGMFQFMILQVICIGLLIAFPKIATWFPGATAGRRAIDARSPRRTRRCWSDSAARPRSRTTNGGAIARNSAVRRARAVGCGQPWRPVCIAHFRAEAATKRIAPDQRFPRGSARCPAW